MMFHKTNAFLTCESQSLAMFAEPHEMFDCIGSRQSRTKEVMDMSSEASGRVPLEPLLCQTIKALTLFSPIAQFV